MSLLRNDKKRMARRGWPIHAYVGPNGGGKTCAAVWDTLPSLEAGRPVLSTVRLLDYLNPRPCDDPACTSPDHARHMAAHPLWIPWTSWAQLLEVEHCDVIADEVTGVASSRESQSMPSVIANALVQLRRRDVVLRWTAPSWSRADLIIRECSQAATLCTGHFAVDVQGEDGEDVARMWRHRRLFRWKTYDAALVDDLQSAKMRGDSHSLRPMTFDLHWGPGSPAFGAYDTFDSVSSIGHVTDSGRCMTCSGRRSAPSCSCPDYVERPRRSRASAGSGGSPRAGSADPSGPAAGVITIPAVLGGSRSSKPSSVADSHLTKANRPADSTPLAGSSPHNLSTQDEDARAHVTPLV